MKKHLNVEKVCFGRFFFLSICCAVAVHVMYDQNSIIEYERVVYFMVYPDIEKLFTLNKFAHTLHAKSV